MNETNSEIELKPCPFCGSALVLNDNKADFYVARYGSRHEHPATACILSRLEIVPDEYDEWNARSLVPPVVPEGADLLLSYGNCRSLEEARQWANHAVRENLRGSFPAACVVLSMKVTQLEAARASLQQSPAPQEAPDRNMVGATEFITALIFNQPIWPNSWGQDVAAAAFFLTDGGKRSTAIVGSTGS